MDVFKKIFIGIFIVSILCNIITISIYFNKSGKYQTTITELTNNNTALQSKNRELEAANKSARESLESITRRYKKLEEGFGKIKTTIKGISDNTRTAEEQISDIIKRISNVITIIKNMEDNGYSNNNSSNNWRWYYMANKIKSRKLLVFLIWTVMGIIIFIKNSDIATFLQYYGIISMVYIGGQSAIDFIEKKK